MSRTLSSAMISAAFAQQTGECPLFLVEIVHADITTLRFVSNVEDIVSDGETYTAWPFEITVPATDEEDTVPRPKLTIDNVDQSITDVIRSLTSPPTIRVAIILASAPDTTCAGWYEFELKNVSYDALAVSGEMGFEDIQDELYPGDTFNPQEEPGLF